MAGVWQLTKLILRRDRIKLPVWILGVTGSLIAMVPLLKSVYNDDAELMTIYQAFGTNPAGLMLTGPMDAPTFGGMMMIETGLWWAMAVVFMNTLFIVRHTRQNEEMGAQELLLSGRAHRAAGLVAALIVAFVMNLIVAVAVAIGLSSLEHSWSMESAWLYGITLGLFGFAWAAIASLVSQLAQTTRLANGILAGLMGAAFLLRGIGDYMGTGDSAGLLQPAWQSLISPFGWLQATRALTFPDWQPLWALGLFSIMAICLAFLLLGRRDVGAGLLPVKAGHSHAGALLISPFGLTWKLQKNVFFGWFIGVFTMVATVGMLVPQMSNVYESNENMLRMIAAMGGAGAIVPSFLSAMLSLVALMVAAYALHALSRLWNEESSGRLENLLACGTSRYNWLLKHFVVVTFGSLIMLTVAGWALAVFVNSNSAGYTANVGEYIMAGASYFPVVMLFACLYVLLFGLLPRAASLTTWLYYGFVVFMTWLGPLLQLGSNITSFSVMEHIATPPVSEVSWDALGVLLLVAFAMLTVGLLAWRQRNLTS